MRLLELEISNVRGIPHLSLKPDGKNVVVWGPNGSGKSAVVDAIDFLLTGRMARLSGKGTGGITLAKHGPHIDHQAEEAVVRAVVRVGGVDEPVTLERCIARPGTLKCAKAAVPYVEPVTSLAKQGHHVLTRRDVLKYITAEAGARAEEVQALLNITEAESIRKAFVKVQNQLDNELKNARGAVEKAKAATGVTVYQKAFHTDAIMRAANENRAVLGGAAISTLHSAGLKASLSPPAVVRKDEEVNVALVERDFQNLVDIMSAKNRAAVGKRDKELRSVLEGIGRDPQVLRSFRQAELAKLGMTLIDETGSCPLCDTAWPAGKLQEHLRQKLSTAGIAVKQQERVIELRDAIVGSANAAAASVGKVLAVAKTADLKDDTPRLESWSRRLQELTTALSSPLEKYPDPRFDPPSVQSMVAPEKAEATLRRIRSAIKEKYPEATPEQTAWDTLTRLEENLKAVEGAQTALKAAQLAHKRASLLLDSFGRSRDNVLRRLYDDVRDGFVALYRRLHGSDEDGFTARIEPEGAALAFEVDFYGRGTYPPHALHSEGHQDSMGLCLYLALAERLSGGLIELVILDDVVMSVDTDHRRNLCRLLSECFPHRQFLITTHDRTWANQLKSEGVVGVKETLHFQNWSVDYGPEVYSSADLMWDRIHSALEEGDVPTAATRLRRGSEEFFATVCDALKAPVVYKLSGECSFGELLLPAMDQYRKLLRSALRSADSWKAEDQVLRLREIDSIRSEVYKRTYAEQWAVNPSVHYNKWHTFSSQDFEPVVQAFHDLHDLFVCSKCGVILRLATVNAKTMSVRCNCGQVNWNLVPKKEGK